MSIRSQSRIREFMIGVILATIIAVTLGIIAWIRLTNPSDKGSATPETPATPSKLGITKTIKLGTITDVEGFRKAFEANNLVLRELADEAMTKPQFTIATREIEVDLVIVSIKDLGFKYGATRGQIYARAKEKGLELCPPEVGPQLRLQYKDQPKGEWLLIGMEPISVSDNYPVVFRVEHKWLYVFWVVNATWNPDNRWVFVRPRK